MVDENGLCTPVWAQYFDDITTGDRGITFTPTINNLTFTGTAPQISGVYYQNEGFTDFYVKIVPGTSTSSTAGSTNFVLPFSVNADAPCFAVAGFTSNQGAITAGSKTVFTPAWTTVNAPITISGRVKN